MALALFFNVPFCSLLVKFSSEVKFNKPSKHAIKERFCPFVARAKGARLIPVWWLGGWITLKPIFRTFGSF